MIENVIGKQKDVAGRTRFFVLPIENEEGFKNLVEFVSQEFLCDFGPLDEGPGTLVRKGAVEGASLVFVLSDSTGVQFYAEAKIVQKVPAGAFHPRPKVESAVLRLDVRPQPIVTGVDPEWYFSVVRAGFGQKRKQLRNSVVAGLGMAKDAVEAGLLSAGIDPQRRAETLSLQEWGALAKVLR